MVQFARFDIAADQKSALFMNSSRGWVISSPIFDLKADADSGEKIFVATVGHFRTYGPNNQMLSMNAAQGMVSVDAETLREAMATATAVIPFGWSDTDSKGVTRQFPVIGFQCAPEMARKLGIEGSTIQRLGGADGRSVVGYWVGCFAITLNAKEHVLLETGVYGTGQPVSVYEDGKALMMNVGTILQHKPLLECVEDVQANGPKIRNLEAREGKPATSHQVLWLVSDSVSREARVTEAAQGQRETNPALAAALAI